MYHHEAEEAAKVVDAALAALISFAPPRGREGADLRSTVGRIRDGATLMLQNNTIGPDLLRCFNLARATVSRVQFSQVRKAVQATTPVTTAAIELKNTLVILTFAMEARTLQNTRFNSLSDVEQLSADLRTAFAEAEDEAANAMDSETYRALVSLHASINYFLSESARQLPRLLWYRFMMVQPTLVLAQKLYGDAGRADQVRIENRIIHPAFAPRQGRALSV